MQDSQPVADAMQGFYRAFSSKDPEVFANVIANEPGISVIGSRPGEGHFGREGWIAGYRKGIVGWAKDVRLEGKEPRGFEEGTMGFGTDQATWIFPDGGRVRCRLTAVLRRENEQWKIVHLHFSVGVPDDQAMERA